VTDYIPACKSGGKIILNNQKGYFDLKK